MSDPETVMLYDGLCGLCNSTVQFVLKYDRRGTLRFAPLQSSYAQAIIARHPRLQGVDSVVYYEKNSKGDESVSIRSDAALRLVSYLGGWWRLLLIARIIPSTLRDRLYNLVAHYRYRVFGKHESCMIPSPEVRDRFVDLA